MNKATHLHRRIAALESHIGRADDPLPEPLQRLGPGGRLLKFVLDDELEGLINVFRRLEQSEPNAARDAAILVQEIGDRAEARRALPGDLGSAIRKYASPSFPWSLGREIGAVRDWLRWSIEGFGLAPGDLSRLSDQDLAVLYAMLEDGRDRRFSVDGETFGLTFSRADAEAAAAKILVAGQPISLMTFLHASQSP
jgi:hypothetical protein